MIDRRALRHFDILLILIAAALVAYGGLLIYSAHLSVYPEGISLNHPVTKQIAFAVAGLALSGVVAWMDYRSFGQVAIGLYVLALILLVGVLLIGDTAYGSRRWYSIAGQQIQASEIAKLLVVLALARYLADRQRQMQGIRVFVMSLVLAAVPAGLVLVEPDVGTAMVFGAIWAGMVLMAGAPPRYLAILVGIVVAFIPFVLLVISDYQLDRIQLWFDAGSDPLKGGYNILQGEWSVGSGGIFGQGLTEGSQTQLDFLQTSTTDYIFAVLGEELGLVGALVLFALFTALLFRGIRAASLSYDVFGRLIATGIVVMILFQVFINVAVVIRIVPVTGIPLPFISQGGSSLIMFFIALGLLEAIVLRHKQIEF